MKRIMIQFHATTEENIEYINSVSSEFKLFMTKMVLKPFSLNIIDGDLSNEDLIDDSNIRIIFTVNKPNINAHSPNHFYEMNSGSIGLHIGLFHGDSLQESTLSFMSKDMDKFSTANKLASRLKKITKAGAIAVNSKNGAEANVRSQRYTKGAKLMYDHGIKILPIAGNSFYKLPD